MADTFIGVPIDSITEKAIPASGDKFIIETPEGTRISNWGNIESLMNSGIKGTAITTTVPSATAFERYLVYSAGTYTNFKSAGNVAIVVSAADLDVVNGVYGNDVILEVSNGVAAKRVVRRKGDVGKSIVSIAKTATVGIIDTYTITYSDATTTTFTVTNANDAKLPLYSAIKSANIVAGTQFIDDENGNLIYRVKTGQTLLTTELPSDFEGVKVEKVKSGLDNIEINEDGFAIVDEQNNIAFIIDENGDALFRQESNNLRENMDDVMGFSSFGNVGNIGELYFCDYAGNIGVKISQDGKFDSANLGLTTQQNIASIAKSIISTAGKDLSDYNHIITYGQSLSVGQTEKVITAAQSNPYLLCFDGVVRTSAYDKSLTGDVYPINRRVAFSPLVERLNDGTSAGVLRETPSSGTGEMFAKSYAETTFTELNKNIIVSASGWGATTIAQLSKGTTYYNQLITDVTAGKALSDSLGKTYRCLAQTWTQGESDYLASTTTAVYKSAIKQLITDLNNDIKAITGQTEDVSLVCYQLATAMHASRTYPNIALATFDASKEDSRIYIATPMYHMNYNDGFHLKSASSKLLGAHYGDVINRIVMKGETWNPLHIKTAEIYGNVLRLNYHIPDNGLLNFDIPNGINLLNKGFTFSDGSNIIDTVEISNDGQSVIINCVVPPTGKILQYGIGWHQISNAKVNLGNLRDDSGEIRQITIDGTVQKMHNWAVIQEIQL